MSTCYVYIESQPGMWTTGFYDPEGKWNPEMDFDGWNAKQRAAERTHWLNGGNGEAE